MTNQQQDRTTRILRRQQLLQELSALSESDFEDEVDLSLDEDDDPIQEAYISLIGAQASLLEGQRSDRSMITRSDASFTDALTANMRAITDLMREDHKRRALLEERINSALVADIEAHTGAYKARANLLNNLADLVKAANGRIGALLDRITVFSVNFREKETERK